MLTSLALARQAATLGFDLCGVAPAAAFPELRYLRQWITDGRAGEMRYLERTVERRADVRQVMPSARSVVSLATVYNVDRPYSTEVTEAGEGRVARYAWGDDYHDVIGRRTEALLDWMRAASESPFEARCYVDTGPVQERVYGQYAGIGWIGKNTCLINPRLGSWLLLSEIICSLALEPDAPAVDQCGTCTLCLEACPTDALRQPWVLDATRCLSYLTIEVRDAIPEPARRDVGAHIFGCDICQEVCPYNAQPAQSADPAWTPRPHLDRPRIIDLWRLPDAELRRVLKGSAMRRAGVKRLRRNLAVALGNSGSSEAAEALAADAPDAEAPSKTDPLVTEHVAWARGAVATARRGTSDTDC